MKNLVHRRTYLLCSMAMVSCSWNVIPRKADSDVNCTAFNSNYTWLVDSSYSSYPQKACGAGVICGHFSYQKRLVNTNAQALTDSTCAPPFPVQYALVELYDSTGVTLLDSTSTDKIGNWSFTPTVNSTSYIVKLHSKTSSDDAIHTVDVRDHSSSDTNYVVTVSNAKKGQRINYTVPIEDPVTGTVMAGAFNILSVLSNAQQKVLDHFGGVFEHNLIVYWESGRVQATSFRDTVTPGADVMMFVTGGLLGSQNLTDTDEFDDSVLLHEFGHYVDFNFSTYDTPGGSHLDFAIDPRLAWAEGLADFLSVYFTTYGMTTQTPEYRDTFGFGDDSFLAIDINFETNYDTLDVTATDMTGTEVTKTINLNGEAYQASVTEFLWDLYDSTNSDVVADTKSIPMVVLFTSLRKLRNDRAHLNQASDGRFRGMDTVGKFSKILKETNSTAYGTFITAMEAEEGFTLNSVDYGTFTFWPPPAPDPNFEATTAWDVETDITSNFCDLTTTITSGGSFFCWISGRQLLDMDGIIYSSSQTYWKTSWLSKRWFRIEPTTSTTHTFYLKSGCLSDEDYQTVDCYDVDVDNDETTNNYIEQINDLNMALWKAPSNTELYRIGYGTDLLMGTSSGTGAPASDDDDFDGSTQDSDETANGCVLCANPDTLDDNQGSQYMEITLTAGETYFLEVYATSANESAIQQMEGRFRVSVCEGDRIACASSWNAANPGGLGALNEW